MLVLPVYRDIAVASFASIWPKLAGDFFASASASAYTAPAPASDAARAAARAASSARVAARFFDSAHAVNAVHASASSSAFAASASAASTSAESEFWRAVSDDVTELSERKPIALSPLWYDGVPEVLLDRWLELRLSLPIKESWHVWTDWYEERLNGFPNGPPIMELERERVLIPDEDWEQGPAHVNSIIAEIEAKYRGKRHSRAVEPDAIPDALSDPMSDEETARQVRQSQAGTRIKKRQSDGRFIVDPDPPTENAAQQERHAGLRDLLEELLDVCSGYKGNQLPLRIVKNARALLKALGSELAAMDVEKTVRHGLILRVHAEREEGAQAEDRLDEREFPKDVAAVLFGARDAYNRLAIGDDALLAADREAAGPDAEDLDAERAAADKLFTNVLSTADEVLTPELIDVLKDERDLAAEASEETGPAAARAQRRWIATATNVVRAFAESVLSYSDKAKSAGKRLVKDADRRVFEWVKKYKDVLKPLLNDRSVRKALWALIERRIKAEEEREASDDPPDKDR